MGVWGCVLGWVGEYGWVGLVVSMGGVGWGVGVGGHGWMGYLCCEKLLEKFRRDLLDARCSWG